MNMFKIICKCRTLQKAILMFISFAEILVTSDVIDCIKKYIFKILEKQLLQNCENGSNGGNPVQSTSFCFEGGIAGIRNVIPKKLYGTALAKHELLS